MKHVMKLHSTPFEMIQSGRKTIELRLHDEKRRLISIGDEIKFVSLSDPTISLNCRVIALHKFDSFENLYDSLPLLKCGYTENDILTAKIARNGTFAIATQSDGYSSEVAVYNKKGKEIYRWFCADYIINDIQLDDTGRKLVLSAINAQKGSYVSKAMPNNR